jgi:hypothetical protein
MNSPGFAVLHWQDEYASHMVQRSGFTLGGHHRQ